MKTFDPQRVLERMETLKTPRGAFIAAPTDDYRAVWIRDQLYVALAYYYLGRLDDFIACVRVVLDIVRRYRHKLARITPNPQKGDYLHAKYYPASFDEISDDWGHHQLDAIGLLLWLIGLAERESLHLLRNEDDRALIAILIEYLERTEYWARPDNGMWEEGLDVHASSVGACVAGLESLTGANIRLLDAEQRIAKLIVRGRATLFSILPNESLVRSHDMAQFSLIWPYNIAGNHAETILGRIMNDPQRLFREHGVHRYWGDNYFRGRDGISAEWPLGFFWLSIIASERGDTKSARYFFDRGVAQMVGDVIPELYTNGAPNSHAPLAWAHSFALIAHTQLQRLS